MNSKRHRRPLTSMPVEKKPKDTNRDQNTKNYING